MIQNLPRKSMERFIKPFVIFSIGEIVWENMFYRFGINGRFYVCNDLFVTGNC